MLRPGYRGQLEQPGDTIAHLIGSLLGEGHGQNAPGIYTLADEMNKAPRQGAGLTRTRSRQGQLDGRRSLGGSRLCRIKTSHRPL